MKLALFLCLSLLPQGAAFFSSLGSRQASTASSKGTPSVSSTARVQRKYQNWTWKSKYGEHGINYRIEGPVDGPPILLTHGFGANLNHFRFNIPSLVQAGYRVYAMDLLGFGASDKPSNVPYSVELFTQQMIDFIGSQMDSEQPWILAGNSIGGLCSLNVAAKRERDIQFPFDISTIVLFNSAGGMTGWRYKDVPAQFHPLMGHVQYFLLSPYFHGKFVFNTLINRDIIKTVLTQAGIYGNTRNVDDDLFDILLQPAADPGAADVFCRVFTGPSGPTRESLISKVKVPVLALWGSEDGFTPLDDDVRALESLHAGKDWTLDVVDGAGHCLHDERPELVNAKMIDFLTKRGLVGATTTA